MLGKNQEFITIPTDQEFTFTYEQMNINSLFQRLWTQLAVFMRNYIYAEFFDLPSKEAVAERLYKVPADFYNALLIFYGPEVANMFSTIFTNFITKSSRVIEGVKTGDQELVERSVQEWFQIAMQFAQFLGRINLFWDENQWQNLLFQYISLKNQMIFSIASGDYRREIQIYDRVFDLTSIMGTYMARGMIARELQRSV